MDDPTDDVSDAGGGGEGLGSGAVAAIVIIVLIVVGSTVAVGAVVAIFLYYKRKQNQGESYGRALCGQVFIVVVFREKESKINNYIHGNNNLCPLSR